MTTPRSLQKYCREILPLLLRQSRGKRMLEAVAEVVETDRWNSFDKFRETTRTLVQRYEQTGAAAEVFPVQTGGHIGTGQWIIREAADVCDATVDVVAPLRQRLLDYRENPWHAVQWTAGTPREGVHSELVIMDSRAEIERLPADGLVGKTLLTSLDIRSSMQLIADKGATGVITDIPVRALPNATAWTKFGWGGVPMGHATARLVGLVLSQREGKKLRRLAQKFGKLTLFTKVDVRKYVGTHDVVSGIVRGAEKPEEEIWAIAHSGEPGAIDNASGVVLSLEIAQLLEDLIEAGKLPRPRRTIRLLNAYECYGFFAYLERAERPQTPLAGLNIDSVGAKPAVCTGRLEWHSTMPMSARFVDWVGAAILRAALKRQNPGYHLCLEPFRSTADTLIGDPQYGFPCPWITTHQRGHAFDAYHSSADTANLLSASGLKVCAASAAAYLHYMADIGSREVGQLAAAETRRILRQLDGGRRQLPRPQVDYLRQVHATSTAQLQRFLDAASETSQHLLAGAEEVRQAGEKAARKESEKRLPAAARRVPKRQVPLSPSGDNTPPHIGRRISRTGLKPWTLFWADGQRNLAEIAALASWDECDGVYSSDEKGYTEVDLDRVIEFFAAHEELGYVQMDA